MAFINAANTIIDDTASILHTSFEKVAGTTQSTQVKIKASDGAADDYFGNSVAVGSGRIVVGSQYDDDDGSAAGSAYIFDLNGNRITKIVPWGGPPVVGFAFDYFGVSVAVGSGRIVVGAVGDDDRGTDSGAAYIFNLNGTQLAKIKASDGVAGDFFGISVAVGCGRIVVGARGDDELDQGNNAGSAYIFNLNGTQLAKIKASDGADDDQFGYSVAIGCGRIVVGAPFDDDLGTNSGAAYVFDLNGTQLAKIKAFDGVSNDNFGGSVAVGSGKIVVGARGDGDSGLNTGAAYIFDLNGTTLTKITALDGRSNYNFGYSVGVGSGRIVVGAYGEDRYLTSAGAIYIFNLNGTQLAKINASDAAAFDTFGISVAVGSGRIVVGAYQDDDSGSNSGSAYIYKLPETHDTYFENIIDTFRY